MISEVPSNTSHSVIRFCLFYSLLRNDSAMSVGLKLKFVRRLQRSERGEAYLCISAQCLISPLGCSIS